MKNVLLLSLLVFICACSNTPHVQETQGHEDSMHTVDALLNKLEHPKKVQDEPFDISNTVLDKEYRKVVYHLFSDVSKPDKFTLHIPQGNINDTKAILTIEDAEGHLLFSDTVITKYIIADDALYTITTHKEMYVYMIEKIESMLDSSSFYDPNTPDTSGMFPETMTAEEYGDNEVYKEVKKEHRYLFVFPLAEENITYYGYSRKLAKTKVVFSCC